MYKLGCEVNPVGNHIAGLCFGGFVVVEPELGIETEMRFVLHIENKPVFSLPRNTEGERKR